MEGKATKHRSKMDQGIFFYEKDLGQSEAKSEILHGLRAKQKTISAKYFYDQKGSALFEAITQLSEYYPTRTEIRLLKKHQQDIQQAVGKDSVVLEYGSGSSTKIRLLLDALKPKAYVPMDISKDFLFESAIELKQLFPWLEIHATCLDYYKELMLPTSLPYPMQSGLKKVGFFPGSSLGNFEPKQAMEFLKQARETLGTGGNLIIGLDLVKDTRLLNAAYNDSEGVTAQFNLNILNHLNDIGEGSFNTEHFEHYAYYNSDKQRIEMHLISLFDQVVTLFGERLSFKQHEHIVTEHSYKFTIEGFTDFAKQAGFEVEQVWSDMGENFAVFCLEGV